MPREFELRKEVSLPATPERVWEAIATGPGQTAWFMPLPVAPDPSLAAAWDPPRRLVIRVPGAEGTFQAFEYVIEARAGGTSVLRFVHSGFLGDDWSDEFEATTDRGWDMYLHTLAQYLAHFDGRPATYVAAEAPPSSTGERAWPILLDALGLSVGVAPGDPVRLAPEGLAPSTGVVDYVLAPEAPRAGFFLGARTDAGLYRFHGRAPLGMPVAAGHHQYGEGVDGDRAQAAWSAWLGRVFA
ncbi:MAG TPA: SRPBCC domain-containing protein [Candidatus Dormibacteraeota bacterium]|nr:SRPBCC domain-containing protein [Candidatus Dormibacteraeota bacterium]